MRICFLLARRVPDVPSPVLSKVTTLLEAAGHRVQGWTPEARVTRVDTFPPSADLYVLKSHTELSLSIAGVLHGADVPVFNSYPACLRAQDKITAVARLRAAGVATPATWVTGDLELAHELLRGGPLIIKPHRGHRGIGVHLVRTRAELACLPTPQAPVVVQRYVPGPGEDLKVYVAGEHVQAVRKPFDAQSFTRPGVPVPVTPTIHSMAQQVRAAFGLELFGIDLVESPTGPVVVDVNYFPGYKGCRNPAAAVADAIDLHTAQVHRRAVAV